MSETLGLVIATADAELVAAVLDDARARFRDVSWSYASKALAEVVGVDDKERFKAAGISIDHSDAVVGGEVLRLNDEDVGTINSPGWSHRLNKSLALVHLHPSACMPGTTLDVVSDDLTTTAIVEATPFYDPKKSKTRA